MALNCVCSCLSVPVRKAAASAWLYDLTLLRAGCDRFVSRLRNRNSLKSLCSCSCSTCYSACSRKKAGMLWLAAGCCGCYVAPKNRAIETKRVRFSRTGQPHNPCMQVTAMSLFFTGCVPALACLSVTFCAEKVAKCHAHGCVQAGKMLPDG